ncbi:hypothetical protein FB451DRAFT_1327687 [Mycena latifolia]|nr:hypothetical protein FB451DRAFT_1327687 [Mycena latifolia]
MATNTQPSAPDTPNNDPSSSKTTATWLTEEIKAMLRELTEKKDTQMSGNGFKPQVWASVITKVREANPDANPPKDKQKCMNKLSYLKKVFDLYLFVQKFSGTGWDDDAKHATNTEGYVADFVKTYGDQYARCFKSACPYWTELDMLYSGLINKATGENVEHLGKLKKTRRRKSAQTSAPDATPRAGPSTGSPARAPLGSISANTPNTANSSAQSETAPQPGSTAHENEFEDELDLLSITRKPKKRERAETDDESSDNVDENKDKSAPKRQRTNSGGIARRNAEAGTQISRALDNLSAVMAQPLITSEDLSHINEVVEILKDTTLLPEDPRGKLYRAVSTALSGDPALARLFIQETDRIRRIGLLEGILEDKGLLNPF